MASPAAIARIPTAEIAVRTRRTFGRWMKWDDFLTVQINPMFQMMETIAHVAPRVMIPKSKGVSCGMNAGMKATA